MYGSLTPFIASIRAIKIHTKLNIGPFEYHRHQIFTSFDEKVEVWLVEHFWSNLLILPNSPETVIGTPTPRYRYHILTSFHERVDVWLVEHFWSNLLILPNPPETVKGTPTPVHLGTEITRPINSSVQPSYKCLILLFNSVQAHIKYQKSSY